MMKKNSPIIVISHSNLFCCSIATLLKQLNTAQFAPYCTPSKAISKIRELKPNTVIVDIPFTDFSALNLLYKLNKQYHHIKIIVITDNLAPAFLVQLFKIRISACLSKNCSSHHLMQAINHVGEKEKPLFCDEEVSRQISTLQHHNLEKIKQLTRQEFQIVVMLAHGIKTREISKQLHLSIKTVSSYHTQILGKLNLQHNIEIVQFVHQHQLLSLPVKFPGFLR